MATRVYVGRVPYEARESDVERFFKGFGHLEHVLMKRGFCYVEFKDARDASDAIAELNGKSMLGDKLAFFNSNLITHPFYQSDCRTSPIP